MARNQDKKRFLRISAHGCSTFSEKPEKKKKASSELYVDAVVSAENVVGYTKGRRRADRQRNPPKKILSRVKRTISLIRQGKKN